MPGQRGRHATFFWPHRGGNSTLKRFLFSFVLFFSLPISWSLTGSHAGLKSGFVLLCYSKTVGNKLHVSCDRAVISCASACLRCQGFCMLRAHWQPGSAATTCLVRPWVCCLSSGMPFFPFCIEDWAQGFQTELHSQTFLFHLSIMRLGLTKLLRSCPGNLQPSCLTLSECRDYRRVSPSPGLPLGSITSVRPFLTLSWFPRSWFMFFLHSLSCCLTSKFILLFFFSFF